MRMLSLVPKSADDIRDASGQTFAYIESRRFRASLATTTAWVAFAFAFVFGIFALVRATGAASREEPKGSSKPLPASSVLACVAEGPCARERGCVAGGMDLRTVAACAPRRCASPARSPWSARQPEVRCDPRWRSAKASSPCAPAGSGDGACCSRPRRTSRTIVSAMNNGHSAEREQHARVCVDLRCAGRLQCSRLRPPGERGCHRHSTAALAEGTQAVPPDSLDARCGRVRTASALQVTL